MNDETVITSGTSGSGVDDAGSTSASNSQPRRGRGPGKPFRKADPRINRHGRPKGPNEAKLAIIEMLGEKLVNAERTQAKTRFEMIIHDWITSANFQKQKAALELAGFFSKGTENLALNIDLRTLTDSQLERLAAGEDIYRVLLNKD